MTNISRGMGKALTVSITYSGNSKQRRKARRIWNRGAAERKLTKLIEGGFDKQPADHLGNRLTASDILNIQEELNIR